MGRTVLRVPVLRARTRVETAAHARRAGDTTFFRHHAMTARTGAGILAAASLDARRRAPLRFPPPAVQAASASDDRARCPPRPRDCSLVTRSGAWLQLFVAAAAAAAVYGEGEAELRVLVRYGSFIGLAAADG